MKETFLYDIIVQSYVVVLYSLRALERTATHCDTLQHIAKHCNALQHTATYCIILQHIATPCNTLHHTASHCNTLQHTATHCSTRANYIVLGLGYVMQYSKWLLSMATKFYVAIVLQCVQKHAHARAFSMCVCV